MSRLKKQTHKRAKREEFGKTFCSEVKRNAVLEELEFLWIFKFKSISTLNASVSTRSSKSKYTRFKHPEKFEILIGDKGLSFYFPI